MSKEYNLKLDVKRPNYERLCGFKIGDSLAVINGAMLQNSTSYNLTGLTLRVNFKDSKGNLYFQDATKGVSIINPLEGTFKINVLPSVLSVEGIIKADISIFKGTQKLTSSTFSMEVVESIYNGTAIIGEGGKDLLQEIVEGEAKRINAEKVRESNEVVRKEGEVKREEKEVVRESNEVDRKNGYLKMDTRIDNLVLGQGSQTEVIDSRLDGVSNKLYPTLKARLDATSKLLGDNFLTSKTISNSITTLDNGMNGILQIDSIKGRTLQNLCNGDFINKTNVAQVEVSKNKIIFKKVINATDNYRAISLIPLGEINTEYTLLCNVSGLDGVINKLFLDAYSNASYGAGINNLRHYLINGFNVIKFASKPNFEFTPMLFFNFERSPDLVKDVIIENVMLLKGDYTSNPLSFFEGIKSTGEDFSDVNLFDKSKVTLDSVVVANGNLNGGNTGWYATDFISVREGMEIRFNQLVSSTSGGLGLYNEKVLVSWISNTVLNAQGRRIRIPNGVNYIRASNHSSHVPLNNFIINQEEYVIKVLSQGKNLFDKSKIIKGILQIANTGGTSANPKGWVSTDYIHVNQNTDYTIAKGIGSGVYGYCFYDSSKTYISGVIATSLVTNPQTITTPPHTAYIKLSGLVEALDTQQFELGTVSTQYEPYASDNVDIPLGSPLKGLTNVITDEIIGDRVNRRIDKVALNGSEIYKLSRVKEKTILYTTTSPTNAKISNLDNMNILSNNFIGKYVYNLDEEGIFFSASQNIYISISKSKLTTPDVAGFKKWLTENPTEVYYELEKQTVSSINPSSLKSFQNGRIVLNNIITPIIDLKYPTSIGGRLSSVESTLDDTVDRVVKLEEGLLTTVTQVIDNKESIKTLANDVQGLGGQFDQVVNDLADTSSSLQKKMLEIKTVNIAYQGGVTGSSVAYKNNQVVFFEFIAFLPTNTIDTLVPIATIPLGYRPVGETNIIVAESAGTGMALLNITKNGDIRIRKFGATGIRNISCNVNYITNN